MIENVFIYPRRHIADCMEGLIRPKGIPEGTWALISIYGNLPLVRTFDREKALTKIGCKHFLSLQFHDITDTEYEEARRNIPAVFQTMKLFGEKQARQIVYFVDKVAKQEIPTLAVHCSAGISRSGAVGAWVCRYLNLDEKEYRRINNPLPNLYVLRMLNEVSGINDEYQKFWESVKNEELRETMRFVRSGGNIWIPEDSRKRGKER